VAGRCVEAIIGGIGRERKNMQCQIRRHVEPNGPATGFSAGSHEPTVSPRSALVTLSLAVLAMCLVACSRVEGPSTLRSQSQGLSGVSASTLTLEEKTNSCGANQTQTFFEVLNGGTQSVKLSDVTIKFWVDDTSGASIVPAIVAGGCLTNANGCFHQVSGVTSSAQAFAPACGSDSKLANWEITITNSDPTALAAGVKWADLQSQLHLANFANFKPGTASWYSSCLAGADYASDVHYAVYVKGALVSASPGVPPSCRAPHGTQLLSGEVPPAVASAPLVGALPGATMLELAISLPLRNTQSLDAQIQQVSDPSSPSYRQYLTPNSFASAFGPTPTDYQALISFVQANGLSVAGTYKSRALLAVRGSVANI
jgi:hypothetical protein